MNKDRLEIENPGEFFGPLYQFVSNDDITDIDYNGQNLFLTDSKGIRSKNDLLNLDDDFVEIFTKRVANLVSQQFHKMSPILEAETDTLRITIVHESAAISGRCICIRKSLPYVRMTEESMVENKYASLEIIEFLKNCVSARMNLVFAGEPGVGKTEAAKFFSQCIPAEDRVITIEDNPEWHYASVNPGKDCVELKINPNMDYTKAIKTCLRLNPKWMFLSEARSTEVKFLIEGFSTGVRGITTIHADDVRNIPDRMLNMAGVSASEKRFENDIYSFVDVAVLIKKRNFFNENGVQEVRRYIDQIGLLHRSQGQNEVTMIVEDGELINRELPESIMYRFYSANIYDAFNREADIMTFANRIALKSDNLSPVSKTDVEAVEEQQRELALRQVREEEVQSIMKELSEDLLRTGSERGTYRGSKQAFR